MTDKFSKAWPFAQEVIDYIAHQNSCSRHEATIALQGKMIDGTVTARGPIFGAGASDIPSEFWRFALPGSDGRAVDLSSGRQVSWFEIKAVDVLAIWPPKVKPDTAREENRSIIGEPRRRGPRPRKFDSVVEAMRASDQLPRLNEMTEEEMTSLFSAGRDTCRRARSKVLSEIVGN